jgi:hypothetical protein
MSINVGLLAGVVPEAYIESTLLAGLLLPVVGVAAGAIAAGPEDSDRCAWPAIVCTAASFLSGVIFVAMLLHAIGKMD